MSFFYNKLDVHATVSFLSFLCSVSYLTMTISFCLILTSLLQFAKGQSNLSVTEPITLVGIKMKIKNIKGPFKITIRLVEILTSSSVQRADFVKILS